jgi:hypothetical protein
MQNYALCSMFFQKALKQPIMYNIVQHCTRMPKIEVPSANIHENADQIYALIFKEKSLTFSEKKLLNSVHMRLMIKCYLV